MPEGRNNVREGRNVDREGSPPPPVLASSRTLSSILGGRALRGVSGEGRPGGGGGDDWDGAMSHAVGLGSAVTGVSECVCVCVCVCACVDA